MKTELATFESMSLEALEVAAQSAFEECEHVFQAIEKNRNRLEMFGRILTSAKNKVPHGQWEDWITDTFQGRLKIRSAQLWMSKAQKVALLEESKNDTVPRADRIPDRVEVVESTSEPGQQHVQPDDDPAPKPPTIRKAAKGSVIISEADKPRTQPIVPEIVADEEPKQSFPEERTLSDWCEHEILEYLVTTADDAKRRAKALRKAADKLDPPTKFVKPDIDDVKAYFAELKAIDPDSFFDFYESKGWLVGKTSMKDWRASARKWARENQTNGKATSNGHTESLADRVASKAAKLKDIFG